MPFISYEIQNSTSYCIKSGYISCDSWSNLIFFISSNSNTPINEIIGLYDVNGYIYNYNDFINQRKVIAKLSSSYSFIFGVSSLKSDYSSLKNQYDSLKTSIVN